MYRDLTQRLFYIVINVERKYEKGMHIFINKYILSDRYNEIVIPSPMIRFLDIFGLYRHLNIIKFKFLQKRYQPKKSKEI